MTVTLRNPMIAIVWLVFLLPGRFVGMRLDLALAVAVAAVAGATLWTKPSSWESRAPARRAFVLLGVLQGLYVFSYLYALAFKGAQTGPQDILDLPRWLLLGTFVVYLIRHHDASVREATDSAAAAAAYASWFLFDVPGERAYAAALCLCYLLLFSRSKKKYVHAAAAAVSFAFAGARLGWSAPADALRHVRLSPFLGWGPGRYELLSPAGQYVTWLAKDGALGALLIAGGLLWAFSRLLRDEDDLRRRAALAAILLCGALLLMSGPYLDSFRLLFMTSFLFAAVHEHGEVRG